MRMEKYIPRVAISQITTPYDQTSEAVVNSLLTIDSIAIHFQGSRPLVFLTYMSLASTIRDIPKSEIFSNFPSPTKMFLQAKSR